MNVYDILNQNQSIRVSDGLTIPILKDCDPSKNLLVLIWSQLGDFDSLEYAWWLEKKSEILKLKDIQIRAIGIGDRSSGLKFCEYTGFPTQYLFVDSQAKLHQDLKLYAGLTGKFPLLSGSQNAWVNLMLMCAGIGSSGTLKEVLRGYVGDRNAGKLIEDEEIIKAYPLPPLKGEFFNLAGKKDCQRPFELATLRLRNMNEVLRNWKTYVPDGAYLTQRGGTFYFDSKRNLIYEHRDQGVLGFAENMSNPLGFLDKVTLPKLA